LDDGRANRRVHIIQPTLVAYAEASTSTGTLQNGSKKKPAGAGIRTSKAS